MNVAIGGVVVAFGALVAARYLSSTGFAVALFGISLGLAVTLHAGVAGALRWALRRERTPALAAAVVAAAAAVLGRAALFVTIGLSPETARTIDPVTMGTAAVSFTGALAGLGWSVTVLARQPPPSWLEAIVSTLAVAACLYALGPLSLSLGLPVSPWTFLSLAAVGVLFYGVRRALSRSSR